MSDATIDSMVTITGAEYVRMTARIAQLEAALREIADMIPHAMPDYTHQVWKTARAALGGET